MLKEQSWTLLDFGRTELGLDENVILTQFNLTNSPGRPVCA